MNDQHSSENRTMDSDSLPAVDKDTSSFVAYSRTETTFAPTILPVGITQISPNGINDDVDRYLFAPIPPLDAAHCGTTTASFFSPTNVESTSNCEVPSSSAVAAASLQNDHRHVTPMPVETLSPVSALSMARGSIRIAIDAKNAIEATNESHAAVVAHTSYEEQVLTAYNSYSTSEYFPVVVQRMISENCQMYNGSLMYWTDCGKFFSVNANHAKLSSVIGKHFKHNNYQSLRRQLNSYGFHRVATGKKKGYWYHPSFSRDCSFVTLKSIGKSTIRRPKKKKHNLQKRSNSGQIKKIGKPTHVEAINMQANLSKPCIKIVSNKGQVKQSSKCAPLKWKSVSSTGMALKKAVNHDEARSYQLEISYENKFYSSDRHESSSVEEETEADTMKGIASSSGGVTLLVEDPFLLDLHYGATPLFEDSSNDALAALATVASFLPIEPTPLYTPITKSCNVIKSTPIHQAATSTNAFTTQDIKMTILADAASQFVATPIQLPRVTDCDYSISWNDNIDCCFDDAVSSYSFGTLSPPPKLILPFNDGSVFLSPVVSSTDHMVAEFCDSFS